MLLWRGNDEGSILYRLLAPPTGTSFFTVNIHGVAYKVSKVMRSTRKAYADGLSRVAVFF